MPHAKLTSEPPAGPPWQLDWRADMEKVRTRSETRLSADSPPGRVPPELPYSIRDHTLAIAIAWSILVINSCIVPLALFYALWFGTALSRNIVLAINTAVFGFITLVAWAVRLWRLLQRDASLRPLGSKRGSVS